MLIFVSVYRSTFRRCVLRIPRNHSVRQFASRFKIVLTRALPNFGAQSNSATKMSNALAGKGLFFCRKVLIFLRVVNRANGANDTLSKLNFPCVNFAGLRAERTSMHLKRAAPVYVRMDLRDY